MTIQSIRAAVDSAAVQLPLDAIRVRIRAT